MDSQQCEADIVKCIQHPQTQIAFIYCKQNCPYQSRLACKKCVKEYNTLEGFEDILEVLNDPKLILNYTDQSNYGIYDKLNTYFDLLEQDPDEFIKLFKKGIQRQIEKLELDLKQGIERFKKFRSEISKVKAQFNEALGHEQFKQAFKDILKVEGYHFGPEWDELTNNVQKFILQFKQQNNQELKEAYQKIKQMEANLVQPQILSEFQRHTSKSVKFLSTQLASLGIFNQFSKICDPFYCSELIQKISQNAEILPKVSLLFKASEHGMNCKSFWEKCSNQGPTITICKSKNGYVFGGYSPCKWIPNVSAYQKDESKTSFLFSYTRKEIYPILLVDSAIYCQSNYGPTFGNGFNLNIGADFQSGHSKMTGQYYANETYKIENQQTHLMGSETPQLVEMEVFLIEK